jgi:hypothetical protein
MITSIEPKAGSWILLVGPRSLNLTMLTAIARLGEGGPVRVLDGGNRFNAYTVARAARGRPEILNRITVSRAFTCYQVLSLLESMAYPQGTPMARIPPAPVLGGVIILDLLSTFYDESVQIGERKRLLRVCIKHLEQLVGPSAPRLVGGVVSVHPPRVPSQAAIELLGMLQDSATDTYFIQPAEPALEPMRLF